VSRLTDEITEFTFPLTREDFDLIVELGKVLGIVSDDPFPLTWKGLTDDSDGTIEPLKDSAGHFWYCIEFADHSLSKNHIEASIQQTRELAIKSGGARYGRTSLLIVCRHDGDAADLDAIIEEIFSHDSPAESNNPHVFVIRWSDVKATLKMCSCGKKEKISLCRGDRCGDCCDRYCTLGSAVCQNKKIGEQIQSDYAHRSDYG
jgi:hypothetical protein